MMGKFIGGLSVISLLASGSAALAQETSGNRVAAETDWSVFVETDPSACWSVSTFKESVNTRDGRVVAVNRGEILLFVSYIPSAGVDGQVSVTGGYTYAQGSTVKLEVDGTVFNLLTVPEDDPSTPQKEDEFAWATAGDDAKIVAAMKRGATAVVSARSSRGTDTKDTFSLLGFTAATDEAKKRCSG